MKSFRVIFWGGLVAGIMDLTAAFIISGLRGRSPVRLLQYIAAGLLGTDAYTGGAGAAALGGISHFLIAFSASAVYYAASRKLPILWKMPIVCGMLYGVAVYSFMNLVVLPLSALPNTISYTPQTLTIGLTVHMVCVGLPIALVQARLEKSE